LKLTWERGLLQIEVAEMEMDVAKLTADVKLATVEAADNEIERRKIVSPIDGIVDHVMVHVGEWVQPGQPVMELVRVDRLRVEAFLNAYEVSPREVEGRQVVIEVPVGSGKTEQFRGHIEFVSSQVVADGAYRVWMEFDNRKDADGHWVVRPGLTATMKVDLRTPAVRVQSPKLEAAPAISPVLDRE
jgi:macrolide-specific efflux system membrane fusion protein